MNRSMGKASRKKRERYDASIGTSDGLKVQQPKTTPEILRRTHEILETASLGADLARDDPDPRHKISGVRNVVVFGRAVTNVLQNLRGSELKFDVWYGPIVERMENDSLMRFLYELRTRILKQGDMPITTSMRFSGDPIALMRQFPKPPRAKSFFIGDSLGGSGWLVQLPDGQEEKFYVNLPNDIPGLSVDVRVHFDDAPAEFRGMPVSVICDRYIKSLREMVADADRTFGKVS